MIDVSKYGGYKKYTGAYFFLVEHTVKKKRIRSLEAMPLYLKDVLDTDNKMVEYCKEKLGYIDPSIKMRKIKMYSLVKIDGAFFYLTGRTGDRLILSNAVELKMPYKWIKYIKRLFSATDHSDIDDNYVSSENNLELYEILMEKHKDSIYSKRPNSIGEKLTEWTNRFKELSINQQVYILRQILQISSSGNQGADLQLLGGAAKTGISLVNKRIGDHEEFSLITMSPAGIYQNKIDLVHV